VGGASVRVAGCQHGLPQPPLVEFQGEDVDAATDEMLSPIDSHAPEHVDAAMQGDS
jgi:hypothetical protein